jgi:Protein of unknown function (DUF3667)
MHGEPIPSTNPALCLNCGTSLLGPHCHQCGQGAHVQRFNWHRLVHELPHAVFHVSRGIVPTVRGLLLEPGRTIRAYLDGQHARFFNPLTLLVLSAGAYAVLYQSAVVMDAIALHIPDRSRDNAMRLLKLVVRWYSLSMALLIPIAAVGTWLTFRNAGRNFAEHVVAMTFVSSMSNLLMVLPGFPLVAAVSIFRGDSENWLLAVWVGLLCLVQAHQSWALYDLFRESGSGRQVFWKVNLTSVCTYIGFGVIGLLTGWVWSRF